MKLGAIVPQGWNGEFNGWDPLEAWRRSVAVAQQADRLGFESLWLFDHFHTVPRPTDEITFESFTSLSALAALTERSRSAPGSVTSSSARRSGTLRSPPR
jgi:alkanesulfonate monooxygenase SsuD/methylene tetrahydromethanopterin reductase-like flavin-dependent oxidoreductase (luciferase family)